MIPAVEYLNASLEEKNPKAITRVILVIEDQKRWKNILYFKVKRSRDVTLAFTQILFRKIERKELK